MSLSFGASKLGAMAKLSAPVLLWIANRAASAPPAINQVTALSAVNVCTAVLFSATDTLAVAPVAPPGPVITARLSTVMLAAAFVLPATSLAPPERRVTLMAAAAVGVTVRL